MVDVGPKVLVIETSPEDRGQLCARLGSSGVADPIDVQELALRILTILQRRTRRSVLAIDDVVIDEPSHVAVRGDHPLDLTATEFRLLGILVRNAGIVMSKRQLLHAAWGFDGYDVNLVEVHVSALRRKLEQHGPRIIHTVRSLGYVARPPSALTIEGRRSAGRDELRRVG